MTRQLDRNRSYGTISPALNGAIYVQDNILYDHEGNVVDDSQAVAAPPPPPPPKRAAKATDTNGPADNGAVSASGDQASPAPLTAKPLAEWQTMNWFLLRGAVMKQFGINPANKGQALAALKERGLIIEG